jgi:hypothetical protein
MAKVDLYYSIFCLIMGAVATYLFYQAWVNSNKTAILVICIMLGFAYSDKLYSQKSSFVYGFIKGLTQQKDSHDKR